MEMDLSGFYQEHFYVRDERLLSCLVENSKVRLVPKNEVFQRMGQVNPNLDIMVHGLVRGFFPDCTGKDITDCFEFSPGIPLMTSFELNEVSVIRHGSPSGDGHGLHAVGALDAFFGPPRCDAVLRPVFKQGPAPPLGEQDDTLPNLLQRTGTGGFWGSIPG